MNGKDKIEQILSELELKAPTFANIIGVPYPRVFDIQRGKTKKISGDLARAISVKYPQYTYDWLLENGDVQFGGSRQDVGAIKENHGVVGMVRGDFHSNGGKDMLIDEQKAEVNKMFEAIIVAVNGFQKANKRHDDYVVRQDDYIKRQDEYIARVINNSYTRNKENMERQDRDRERLDRLIGQHQSLIEASNEDRRDMREQMNRILAMLEKKM